MVLPLSSALVRPPPEHHIQFWATRYKRDMDGTGAIAAKGHKDDKRTGEMVLEGWEWLCSQWEPPDSWGLAASTVTERL